MKTAIITGVTGQDGALLSDLLLQKGYRVIGVARRTSSKTDWRLKELSLYSNINFTIASGDIIDATSIGRIVQEYSPDEFYNLAAMSFVGESWNTPSATMQINAIGCINCLEALRQFAPDCRFYQASTSEMLGGKNNTEISDENSPFYPRSPYGISKLAAHWSTINYRESFGLFACAGILYNHESEYRGLDFVTRKITDGIARIEAGQQKYIELGNLDAYRDWGYAGDFVYGMWLMLQEEEPDDFILATGTTRSIRDFVEQTLKEFSLPGSISDYVLINKDFVRPAEVGCLVGNSNKARQKLGWQPKVSFKEMVKKMVQKDRERVRNET